MMPAISIPASWRLSELIAGIVDKPVPADVTVEGISLNSHDVRPGDLFFALPGDRTHGLKHLQQVIRQGAVAVLWEPNSALEQSLSGCPIPHMPVKGLAGCIGLIADRFFHHPSRRMSIVGVTGTDGKTSVSQFIAQVLSSTRHLCGVIGTLGYGRYGDLRPGPHTTPDAVRLQMELNSIRDQGARWTVMEVSSHALAQSRVLGTDFNVAVLTNLSRDHFDYHGSVEAYASAKSRLFEMPRLGHAVLNLDDPFGRRLADALHGEVDILGYTLKSVTTRNEALVRATDLRLTPQGMALAVETPWGGGELSCRLLGRFNAANLLAALAVLLVLDTPLDTALRKLAGVHPVAGRMEAFGGGDKPMVIVDYAHTPAALEQVLLALKAHCERRLWCVFGCGGERDVGKRARMAAAAERLADKIVVTDDNPRNEPPEAIVKDILSGFHAPNSVNVIHARDAAIAAAVNEARPGDVVLVAGKGHEQDQIIGGRRLPFCDRDQVMARLGEMHV